MQIGIPKGDQGAARRGGEARDVGRKVGKQPLDGRRLRPVGRALRLRLGPRHCANVKALFSFRVGLSCVASVVLERVDIVFGDCIGIPTVRCGFSYWSMVVDGREKIHKSWRVPALGYFTIGSIPC